MTAPRITKGGTRGTVYRDVATLRIEDAGNLLQNGRRNGAVYLAGYAVECQLKYAFCRRKNSVYLPAPLEVHDWERLVDQAGLLKDIKVQSAMDAIYSALVEKWGPSLRYRTASYSESEAKLLYNQMKQLYQFFKDLVP
jgi:HEPN domain-containing protein